jgi:epoxyqueuosine reductase
MTSEILLQWAQEEGFALAAVSANRFGIERSCRGSSCRSLLAAGLVYGNVFDDEGNPEDEGETPATPAIVAPFARRNYYREAVRKLKRIAGRAREECGGTRADYRVYCNSQALDERRIAFECGMADIGRNTLLLTKEYGSLFVVGILALPFEAVIGIDAAREDTVCGRKPGQEPFALCARCGPDNPPCKRACPTGALSGAGRIKKERCIQWYLSGYGDTIPAAVKKHWGSRLYGCTLCQDACPYNQKPVRGVDCALGVLPAVMDARKIAGAPDDALKKLFHRTALGLSWLCPDGLRRNAEMCLGQKERV